MGNVITAFSMSLDGFIAQPNDAVGPLFDWHTSGDIAMTRAMGDRNLEFKLSAPSAAVLQEAIDTAGALVTGRHLFDITGGWGGRHPLDVPVFVVTHTVPDGWPRADAPFTFVMDGVASAIAQAQAVAGSKTVAIASTSIAQQCLQLGLLDGIHIDLVPVLLGAGIRLFDQIGVDSIRLEIMQVVAAPGVTHLTYRVSK